MACDCEEGCLVLRIGKDHLQRTSLNRNKITLHNAGKQHYSNKCWKLRLYCVVLL